MVGIDPLKPLELNRIGFEHVVIYQVAMNAVQLSLITERSTSCHSYFGRFELGVMGCLGTLRSETLNLFLPMSNASIFVSNANYKDQRPAF